jgi:hypothetical protein
MPNTSTNKTVSATLPVAQADRLAQLAKAHGYSLHAFLVRTLSRMADKMPMPDAATLRARDANQEKLPETLLVEITLKLALRLHAAARQLRDPSGKPTTPSALARQLLIHECERTTDIVQVMAEQLDPDYVDIVPFTGRMTKPRGKFQIAWHPLTIPCAFSTRQCVIEKAQEQGVTMADLVRGILHTHLPELPGDR